MMGTVTTITAAGLKQLLDGDNPPLVIDIRDPYEWEEGYITERNIPIYELPAMIPELEAWKQKTIVFYCKEGDRSDIARLLLEEAGFEKVLSLEGGYLAWQALETA
jgi:hydroxyacylglutathione hydrolase